MIFELSNHKLETKYILIEKNKLVHKYAPHCTFLQTVAFEIILVG